MSVLLTVIRQCSPIILIPRLSPSRRWISTNRGFIDTCTVLAKSSLTDDKPVKGAMTDERLSMCGDSKLATDDIAGDVCTVSYCLVPPVDSRD